MYKTLVVNKRGHVSTINDEYIGRPSMGGNPFIIGPDGTREEVITKFEIYARERMKIDPVFAAYVRSLEGKTLVCFCKPRACHGDVLSMLTEERIV